MGFGRVLWGDLLKPNLLSLLRDYIECRLPISPLPDPYYLRGLGECNPIQQCKSWQLCLKWKLGKDYTMVSAAHGAGEHVAA